MFDDVFEVLQRIPRMSSSSGVNNISRHIFNNNVVELVWPIFISRLVGHYISVVSEEACLHN
jgi:hypothetical protein